LIREALKKKGVDSKNGINKSLKNYLW
jgi:hypothetical protein